MKLVELVSNDNNCFMFNHRYESESSLQKKDSYEAINNWGRDPVCDLRMEFFVKTKSKQWSVTVRHNNPYYHPVEKKEIFFF